MQGLGCQIRQSGYENKKVVCLGALDIFWSSRTHLDSYQSLTESVGGDLQQECNERGHSIGGNSVYLARHEPTTMIVPLTERPPSRLRCHLHSNLNTIWRNAIWSTILCRLWSIQYAIQYCMKQYNMNEAILYLWGNTVLYSYTPYAHDTGHGSAK